MRLRPVGLVGVAALLILAAVALLWPRPWLVVRHDGVIRAAFVGGEGARFALRWTHSVEKEAWIETFAVRDGAIELMATRFKTFGAGVPAAAGRRTTLEDGWVVMHDIHRVVDPLAVQAAAAEDYSLRHDGHWHALSEPGKKPILMIENRRLPLYRVLPALIWRWSG
ncbi:hypothetical protein SAOR_03190 [Salinisphaera orenii MK-B5]|uniref:DUF1850 domain-containing protein n=1 Tax=Salinisphaera orenii MK-B5 TaxID=856730 RepID=A0A423PV40_9GAMM|nr:DUF1850 domain-containing protein [Salinisphaera orenii]ROO29470.1 hypothetical protein SAOR_03190 [Salinisphaera orenii MK-B5]